MKASIIIPAFNEEKFIENTIKAVLNQNYPDFEVIVIDNNSTDETASRARALGVTVIHEKNKGTMWACESGRCVATGEVIVRLDADCVPDPDWLAKGMVHFADERVVGATGPYDYFDYSKIFRAISLWIQQYIYPVSNNISQFFGIGALLIGGNSFMRANTLEKMGGFNTDITFYGDDTDTAKRISKYGKVIFDPYLTIKSSARRFKNEGVLKIYFMYPYTFIKHTLLKTKKIK